MSASFLVSLALSTWRSYAALVSILESSKSPPKWCPQAHGRPIL